MHYTIYKVTNQIDGKVYVGSHKTVNLNDNYMGSGKYLKHAQAKHGMENFSKEILFVFDNPEEMYAKEAELVNEDFIAENNTYNIKVGGFGGWDHVNNDKSFREKRNELLIARRRDGTIKKLYGVDNPFQIESVRIANRARTIQMHKDGKFTYQHLTFKGKHHTEEAKRKIGQKTSAAQTGVSNSQFGTMWITNGVENKKIPKEGLVPSGWRKGRKIAADVASQINT